MSDYDLVVRGGTVIDPSSGLHAPMDVAVADGTIAAIAEAGAGLDGTEVIDAAGCYVCPGLIDLHTHLFPTGTRFGISPDTYCLARGTTTALDAGSAGAYTWGAFADYLQSQSTRVFALLNISAIGMPADGELLDPRWADPKAAADVIAAHRDRIVGVKVRLSPTVVGDHVEHALDAAAKAAELADVRLVVHPNKADLSMEAILARLRPGDVITHCFNTSDQAVVVDGGRIRPEVQAARDRGVLFDVGHGGRSFRFDVAEAALDAGFAPDTLSSDLHALNVDGPVHDLPNVLSKFLMLGMSLDDVVAKATLGPGQLLAPGERLGTLQAGAAADILVFRLAQGRFDFDDSFGAPRTAGESIVPVMTVQRGKRVAS